MNVFDELQEAFNACLAVPSDDLRASAEQNISRFVEAARKLELHFLRKQLLLADSSEATLDEISRLRAKLKARDDLLAKYQQKLEDWKKIVD